MVNIEAMLTAILDKGSAENPMQVELTRNPGSGVVAVSAYPGRRRYAKTTGKGMSPGEAVADLTVRMGLETPASEEER